MAKRINTMTADQERRIPIVRAEWIKQAERVDSDSDDAMRHAVANLYHSIGKPAPPIFIMDCPATCLLAKALIRDNLGANLGANLRDNLWDNLRDNLGDNLRDNLGATLGANLGANLRDNLGATLRDNLGANLRDNLGATLRDNLGDNLWDNLGANIWANLGDNLRDNLRDNLGANLRDNLRATLGANLWANLWDNLGGNLRDNLGATLRDNLRANLRDNIGDNLYDFATLWGAHDAGWIAFYDFPREIGIEYQSSDVARLSAIIAYAKTCGWLYAYPALALVSRRNSVLSRYERGRLHSAIGPAMAFRSGWSIHAWHGIRVPSHVIEAPDKITPVMIDAETNQEVRRVMIERYGYERYVSDGTIVHEDGTGRLIKKRNTHGDEIAVVSVVNGSKEPDGTYKRYVLSVPPEMRTACEAVAWTYGMSEQQYAKLQKRT